LATKHQKGELLIWLSWYGEEAVRVIIVVVVVGRRTLGNRMGAAGQYCLLDLN